MEGTSHLPSVGLARRANRTDAEGAVAHRTNGDTAGLKVAHTLTACCRCRTRKTRCDTGLPKCGPCERIGLSCEYYDSIKGKKIDRQYVIYLQKKVQGLETELAALLGGKYHCPDAETMARSAGYVRFKENDESRYLGPSSGIAVRTDSESLATSCVIG